MCKKQAPVAKKSLEVDDHLLLMFGEVAALDARPEIVRPPETAALAASKQPCTNYIRSKKKYHY